MRKIFTEDWDELEIPSELGEVTLHYEDVGIEVEADYLDYTNTSGPMNDYGDIGEDSGTNYGIIDSFDIEYEPEYEDFEEFLKKSESELTQEDLNSIDPDAFIEFLEEKYQEHYIDYVSDNWEEFENDVHWYEHDDIDEYEYWGECLEEGKKKKKPYSSMTITTGDPALNIKFFNQRMGTDYPGNDNNNPSTVEAQQAAEGTDTSCDGCSDSGSDGGGAMGEALDLADFDDLIIDEKEAIDGYDDKLKKAESDDEEKVLTHIRDEEEHIDELKKLASTKKYILDEGTKREIKRYYVRPQNIFCSNKADILRVLAELEGENCSIYSLKNLSDHDDVHKLTNADIIYYYDDRVLYDKNHVQVIDYDLFVKHEEERKHIDADNVTDSEFVKNYDDRMTPLTNDDEDIKVSEAVEPKSLIEGKSKVCCICGEVIDGYGNNAEPYKTGTCCDACNIKFVIPARMEEINIEKD